MQKHSGRVSRTGLQEHLPEPSELAWGLAGSFRENDVELHDLGTFNPTRVLDSHSYIDGTSIANHPGNLKHARKDNTTWLRHYANVSLQRNYLGRSQTHAAPLM